MMKIDLLGQILCLSKDKEAKTSFRTIFEIYELNL